ncbi:MAG: hypothetical protein IT373_24675 [Polyangiaceae bacterium]|nr:hypothetical protein [Polyangiaceae bacterium]
MLGVLLGVAVARDGATGDPAARGLDVFVHAPGEMSGGATVPLQIQAYGFPTVQTATALAGAEVEATWLPESLGPDVSRVPDPVRVTTDALGRAHLDVPVPPGPPGALKLLVGLRSGTHARTRELTLQRVAPYVVELYVPERRVVPGSEVTAWVMVRNAATGELARGVPLELALLEGGLPRQTVKLVTDDSGTSLGRVAIPRAVGPAWSWTLVARHAGADGAGDEAQLAPREETPATPTLGARFEEASVRAGEPVHFVLRLRDAADEPVAAHAVRYWIGPKGLHPPEEAAKWAAASTAATTDATGQVRGQAPTPTTVAPVVGTELTLVVRTDLEGQALSSRDSVAVGRPQATVELLPEHKSVFAGQEQRLLLRVRGEDDKPVPQAAFSVKADGLDVRVTTDAHGEGELSWRAPADVGAYRAVGPCPGEVAVAVAVQPAEALPALGGRTEPFEQCLPVTRDAAGLLEVTPSVAIAGEPVRVRVVGAGHGGWSVVARAHEGAVATSAWLADADKGMDLVLPASASGLFTVTAVEPGNRKASRVLEGAVLVRPRTLPRVEARVIGGRLAPRGSAQLEVLLRDGQGQPLVGTVAAVAQDLYGGGSLEGLRELDTRRALCNAADVERERCDALLEGDASSEPLRRAAVGNAAGEPLMPVLDPAANLQQDIDNAFRVVVHSLEGAVLEATTSAERLRDVRRRAAQGGKWEFNPELWTLVTAALDAPALTPGGETVSLQDLVTIDGQVNFDNVARRATRLRLFRVLAGVRSYRRGLALSPDEPALRDPQALLRRLVRSGSLADTDLLDPWGGTLQFVKATGEGLPFLTVRGYSLHSPGPDGRLSTGDDVTDPFERVLTSGTPYANAVQEDELVDARLDMQVDDATVSAWQELLERLTGTALGSTGVSTMGHGSGTGTGQGFGSGHGRLGGSSRRAFGKSQGEVVWLPPKRTDDKGRVVLEVPLGGAETTWRVALVGLPDAARPAVTMVDVPSSLPVSSRVEAGVSWVAGDRGELRVTVRNRTEAATQATLTLTPGGVAELESPADARRTVDVPAHGAAEVRVRVRAPRAGSAELTLQTEAAGSAPDTLVHEWTVAVAGEYSDVAQLAWVDGKKTIALPPETAERHYVGPAKLVLERGREAMIRSALESLDPDRLLVPEALVEAQSAARAVERWAVARGGQADPLAARAAAFARRAVGRLMVFRGEKAGDATPWKLMAAREQALLVRGTPEPVSCPPGGRPEVDRALRFLALEEAPVAGVVTGCWDALAVATTEQVQSLGDAVRLARLVLAFGGHGHRSSQALALGARLAEQVNLRPTGYLELPASDTSRRAARALVYAALLRVALRQAAPTAGPERLVGWLLLQRDPLGGFGSAEATRAAIEALVAMAPADEANAPVTVTLGSEDQAVQFDAAGRAVLTLPAGLQSVVVRTEGAPLVARVERRRLRPWSQLPTEQGPARLAIRWPTDARAGSTGRLELALSHTLGRPVVVDVKLPLPAGARLAAAVPGVRQVQGVLYLHQSLTASELDNVLVLPLRFELAGSFTVPEAEARLSEEEAPRTLVPAQPLVVQAEGARAAP